SKPKRMHTISQWARNHQWAARFSFVFIYLLLNLVALFFSEALLAEGISVPHYVSTLLCIPFLIAFILYPSRKTKSRYKNYYFFQKSMDGILITFSFLLLVCSINQYTTGRLSFMAPLVHAAEGTVKPIKPLQNIKVQSSQTSFIVKQWKELKKNCKLLRKSYKETSGEGRVALIVLASVVAVALFLLVLGLSCNLSCSGAEGAALTVFILGTGLIAFLLVKVIGAINRKPKKKEREETKPVDS
ncbi:MAG TPA: hypothetical protein VM888_05880, partial [Chitinophagaceae bacterium]|nr:hypothetical protein [Chitinophagaceae bacterium]